MRRHRMDPFSLVFGVVFAMLGVVFLVGRVDASQLHLEWVWPVPLIVLGVLIIALSARPADRAQTPAVEPATEASGLDGGQLDPDEEDVRGA